MNSKKADINMVFVYVTSIVIIAFVGYLVVGFIGNLGSDVADAQEQQFFNDFRSVFLPVYQSFNSEKVQEFKFPKKITLVCIFDSTNSDVSQVTFPDTMINDSENLKFLIENNENLAIFDKNGLIQSSSIEQEFTIEHLDTTQPGGILCFEPINQRQSLFLENRRNDIVISSY
jgi:hypothetical protein